MTGTHGKRLPLFHRPAQGGFTLVELIAIIAVAGILLAVAAPRFFSANTFAARGYADAAVAFLRYAQKVAVARHTTLYVHADSAGLSLCAAAAAPCAAPVPGPDGSAHYAVETPSGVTQTPSASALSFDAQGRPSAAFTLTLTGDSTQTLTVEAETGYVH